ncbi:MAG: hypothetical protein PHY48_14695 [Candidatus Cloacimonetes bacterium]|nr:hypothetical protein [Candidatus Cloacimonadota bacterium]
MRDLYYGHTLSRQTFLYRGAQDDVMLSYEDNSYDDKGRLTTTEYSDGTAINNTWDCCSLLESIDRFGVLTQYPQKTNQLHSKTMVLSPGLLPGANGAYPVSGSYVDLLGRVTNSYRSVNGAIYPRQTIITEYPEYASHFKVTTDLLGVVTTNRISINYSQRPCIIKDETIRAGVTTTAIRLDNGEPETTIEWTDPVSGEQLKKMAKAESDIQPNGWKKTTAYVKYDDGEWIMQSVVTSDFLGRGVASSRAGTGGAMLTTSNLYNNAGLLVRTISHDGSSTVFDYNELGERTATISIAAGQTLDFDPLSFTLTNIILLDKYVINLTTESTENTEGEWWSCATSMFYKPGEDALTTAVHRTQLTGLTLQNNSCSISIDADENKIINTESVDPANATKVAKSVDVTFNTTNVSYYVAGYETYSSNSLGGVTEHFYDGFSRRTKTTNYANGRELKSVVTYHDDGSLATVDEVTACGTNTTSYSTQQVVADKLGAYKIAVTDAKGNQTVNYYSGNGQIYRSEGATYPTETAFDAAGRMTELHTWRNESGNSDITRWHYDLFTGAVTNKLYADGKSTAYTYLDDGRIATRKWARNIITTYGYADTATGSIRTTDYNDDTPSVTNYYNLIGQLIKVEDGTGTTTFGYDSKGRLIAETNAFEVITRSYDTYGRYSELILNPVNTVYPVQKIVFGYDAQNRLNAITSIIGTETNVFTYTYLPGTQFIRGYTATTPATDTTNLIVTRTYEPNRNLISAVTNSFVALVPSVVSFFNYSCDSTGKRTSRIDYYNGSTVTNTFGYNIRSEVTNAVMNSNEHSIVYDDIGNREQSAVDSDQLSVTNLYTANNLNQYTSVNSAGSTMFIQHDLDGNLTCDGVKWKHSYDAENRLVKSEPYSVTNGAYMFEYKYNYKNLRVEKFKKELSGREAGYPMNPQANPGTWNPIETRNYIWDGWNIAAEIIIDHVTPATNISYYTWGLDLSGTLQGAGGVGGLLCDTKVSSSETNTYFAVGDANGNITEYVDVFGSTVAHGEHNAFGETKYSGSMKDGFTHWFSSKPFDKGTTLVSYELRFYKPPLARWLSRDPAGIKGGLNEVGFVNNDVINKWDYLGLAYGDRLTKKEAKQLACAINKFLKYASLGNAIAAWGDSDKSLTIKFLKNYMSKSGSAIILKYNQLKSDTGIIDQNQKAYKYLLNNPLESISLIAYTHNDLSTSVGRVIINYSKEFGFIKAYFPSEKYTFSDTKSNEKINVSFPGLDNFSKKCCWEGSEHISDKWMHDLEIHGHAKSFNVRASWNLFSELNFNQ